MINWPIAASFIQYCWQYDGDQISIDRKNVHINPLCGLLFIVHSTKTCVGAIMLGGRKYRARNTNPFGNTYCFLSSIPYHPSTEIIRNNKRLNDEKLLLLCNFAVLTLQPTSYITFNQYYQDAFRTKLYL